MGTITTCVTDTAKMDFMQAGHLIAVSNSQVGNVFGATANTLLGSLTNTYNLIVGMTVFNGNNLNAANTTTIARIINSTAVELSETAAASSNGTYTFTGDTLYVGLIKFSPTGSYDRNTKCWANVQADEASGAGYSANGQALTVVAPGAGLGIDVLDSNTAITNFSNPSWTSATLNLEGMAIYNRGVINNTPSTPFQRIGYTPSGASANSSSVGLANVGANASAMHVISLHDFGGQQQVTSGTFTVSMPTANGTAAILRLSVENFADINRWEFCQPEDTPFYDPRKDFLFEQPRLGVW